MRTQARRRFLHSLTAVSMFCSRLIQAVPVASWLHKHSSNSSGRHTAAWQSDLLTDLLLGPTNYDRWNWLTFFHSFQHILYLVCFPQVVQKQCWVRWETEWSFDGRLCQEYLYQKLSESNNWFSSYGRKCWGCFFGDTLYIGLWYWLGGCTFLSGGLRSSDYF